MRTIGPWIAAAVLAAAAPWGCGYDDSVRPDADVAADEAADGAEDGTGQDASECPDGGGWLCGSSCVDLEGDPDNCGDCGVRCRSDEVCDLGECGVGCSSGLAPCDGSCVDLASDLDDCGTCGNACAGGLNADATCDRGSCDLACLDGFWDIDGEPGCEYACTDPDTEVCNGEDDDCDGDTDEGFTCRPGEPVACATSCGSTGTGACTDACSVPGTDGCTPPAEACNGLDDDCDTGCDDDFTCCAGASTPCMTACGTIGARICGSDCEWGACEVVAESCNGMDDDCDDVCDNGFECCRRAAEACTTFCGSTGSRTCGSGCAWSECAAPHETCNGADDDCDDACDNGFTCCRGETEACDTTCGAPGTRTCLSTCTWGLCAPPVETCNGLDDDCDTTCDDGFECCRGVVATCTNTCGASGTRACGAACTLGACCAAAEVCGNTCDDNCDGAVNEDCTRGDTCTEAILIPPGTTTVSGDTSTFANDYDGSCAGGSGPDAVYYFVAPRNDTVSINTCGGASFDTVLSAQTVCTNVSTEVACNDDSCGLQSSIGFAVTAGTTYYVFVDGYSTGAMGPFTLAITGL